MNKLQESVKVAEERVRALAEQLAKANTQRDECERKINEVTENIKKDYKRIHGEEIYSLRQNDWNRWHHKLSAEECLDQIINDFVGAYDIKLGSLSEKIEEIKEKERITHKEYLQVQTTLVNADVEAEETQKEIDRLKQRLIALQQDIKRSGEEKDKLRSDYDNLESELVQTQEKLIQKHKDCEKLQKVREFMNEQIEEARLNVERIQREWEEQLSAKDRKLLDLESINGQVNVEIAAGRIEKKRLEEAITRLKDRLEYEQRKKREYQDQLQVYLEREGNQRDTDSDTSEKHSESVFTRRNSLFNEFENLSYSQVHIPEDTNMNSSHQQDTAHNDGIRSMETLLHLTMKIIPIFDGGSKANNAADLDKYIQACEIMMESAKLAETSSLLKCFKMRLSGDPYHQVNISRCGTFQEIKQVLMDKYKKKYTYQECMRNIRSCQQQPGEETTAFTQRAERLYKIAGCAIDETFSGFAEKEAMLKGAEMDMIVAVQKGLRSNDTKRHIVTVPQLTNSLEDLIKEIERYENGIAEIEGNISKPNDLINVLKDPLEDMRKFKTELFEEVLQLIRQENRKSEIEKDRVSRSPFRSNGNRAQQTNQDDDGRQRSNHQNNNQHNRYHQENGRNSGNYRRGPLICYNCQGEGHFASECTNEYRPRSDFERGVCMYCNGRDHDFNVCAKLHYEKKAKEAEAKITAANGRREEN